MRKHEVCGKGGTHTCFGSIFTTDAKILNIYPTGLESVNTRKLQITANNIEVIPTYLYFLIPFINLFLKSCFSLPDPHFFSTSGNKKAANQFTSRLVPNPTANADHHAINKFRFQAINTNK